MKRGAGLRHAACLTFLLLTLLLAGCCPAALPSTAQRTPATDLSSSAGVSASMTAAPSLPITAFVAVLEIDADGTPWALSGHGNRTRLSLQRLSGEANPPPTYGLPGPASPATATATAGLRPAALRPGELVYVTGDWSADGTLEVASIQAMASVRP